MGCHSQILEYTKNRKQVLKGLKNSNSKGMGVCYRCVAIMMTKQLKLKKTQSSMSFESLTLKQR